ncbi:hypothetical protein DW972_14305 [Anaerobutyricum hallii]|uniref:Uncharacterized protein n=1 Tax=Anaerobutyricum hallii TaxID=39488 RepID=A0A413PNB0_9FIRM|nr:DUF6442 family protein [Anaerobutyricum hallii]RGZ77579.1 hypothetical protein DW972_14305 [Anaerobutyricum hallii]
MDKEKILSQNKKENLYLDEYEKHIKLQGKSFGLMFVLFICILILFREIFWLNVCFIYLHFNSFH